ncbi:helix-turn-helix domain-containing protein [Nonomuraea fuscirosea]|uniref:helix-turn-helix domain-containing protein n=1 Tax=Nonomuraea fuscirosea TaxID=1291556 RepID=UPI003442378A
MLTHPGNTVSSIARLLGVSRSTIYKYVPELTADSRSALSASTPAALPAAEQPGAVRSRPQVCTRARTGTTVKG